MSTVYNYDNVVKVAESIVKNVKAEIAKVANSMNRRVEMGDYYMSDLVSGLVVLESALCYLESVSRHFERGFISQLSPLDALDSLIVNDDMLKGYSLYSREIMQALKNAETVTV